MTAVPSPSRRGPIERFPRWPLYSALALIGFSIAATFVSNTWDIGTVKTPVTYPLEIRDVRFLVADDDTITVLDGAGGETIKVIAPNTEGFIHGSLRGLSRDRKLRGLAYDLPYRIIRWDDGRLTLSDTATGMRVQLDPFGPTNAAAYAQFLEGRSVTR
ncbi:MAG: photosynthetic complex assembly protein PuhC [Alsobacter sp.]